jgi:hypothetical protein
MERWWKKRCPASFSASKVGLPSRSFERCWNTRKPWPAFAFSYGAAASLFAVMGWLAEP